MFVGSQWIENDSLCTHHLSIDPIRLYAHLQDSSSIHYQEENYYSHMIFGTIPSYSQKEEDAYTQQVLTYLDHLYDVDHLYTCLTEFIERAKSQISLQVYSQLIAYLQNRCEAIGEEGMDWGTSRDCVVVLERTKALGSCFSALKELQRRSQTEMLSPATEQWKEMEEVKQWSSLYSVFASKTPSPLSPYSENELVVEEIDASKWMSCFEKVWWFCH